MIAQHLIQAHHVSEMVTNIKSHYHGDFSSSIFLQEIKVPCRSEEEYITFLSSLREPSDVIEHIVNNVVKMGIFEVSDFRQNDQIIYVNGKLEVDVTEGYLNIISKD